MHSLTKYIGGHSDIIGGALMVNDKELYDKLAFVQMAVGAVPSPLECFLLSRSIKTIAVRMGQHEKSALEVAQFLSQHEKSCKNVRYPGLENHPQHELAKNRCLVFSGMISFELICNYEKIKKFFK